MKKLKIGLLLGLFAGIIDAIPMLIQDLPWDANISAFSFWIVAGFFISTTDIKIKGALKGLIISLILFIPLSFIIGWQEPLSLIPILIMNIILGAALGYFIDKLKKYE